MYIYNISIIHLYIIYIIYINYIYVIHNIYIYNIYIYIYIYIIYYIYIYLYIYNKHNIIKSINKTFTAIFLCSFTHFHALKNEQVTSLIFIEPLVLTSYNAS